jgi:hypothetical protein
MMPKERDRGAGLTDATELLRRTLSAEYHFRGSVGEFREWLRRQDTLYLTLNGGEAMECWAERTS